VACDTRGETEELEDRLLTDIHEENAMTRGDLARCCRQTGAGTIFAILTTFALLISPMAFAQAGAPKVLTDHEIRELLVWNSPWESRALTSNSPYSFRTIFVIRRGELVAQVMRYSTGEMGDSVVDIKEGRAHWQDSSGNEITVSVDHVGELVGTATSKTTKYSIAFKQQP
jgi:hypothetical protein